MPGTTRYSATFDRTYEEDDRVDPSPPPNARRSRSQSWQANSGLDTRPYTPLGIRPLNQRSSSTDNGSSKPTEHIPTRTVVKTVVKPHTNPFQFVKVGTCPLYKKAEEQLKKVKEVKKPDVLKEEEEEWQTNLDSWKSRRRKMSEDVFRRQEEIKQFELEEQVAQEAKKKTKTFSEMVESRAHRGRALSLCLISSPLELTNWEFESNSHKNGSCSTFSGESEENSTVNSEDEGVSLKNISDKTQNSTFINHRTNGDSHIENNTSNSSDFSKLDLSTSALQIKPKEGSYIDSGLESISSHRAGDTPDSGSDFSHDSGSSIDCDSPRTGVNILDEFSVKSSQNGNVPEFSVKLCLNEKELDFGFTFLVKKDEGQVIISSISEGGKADLSSIRTGDRIISINGEEIGSKTQREIVSLIQKGRDKGELDLLLWRHTKCTDTTNTNGFKMNGKQPCENKSSLPMSETQAQKYERSVESDNEMYVDDFEELERQVELMTSSKSEMHSQAKCRISGSNKDVVPSVMLSEASLASNGPNGSAKEPSKNMQNCNSEIVENIAEKKGDIKLNTRTRRKGVYALNVSNPPAQNSKDGFSVNSLFPLSPVTELPSPEDAKSLSSSISSNLTSVSDTNTALTEETNAKVAPIIKDVVEPITNGDVEIKLITSEHAKNSSQKEEKASSPVPSPAIGKNLKLSDNSENNQEKKTKIVRKVKKVPKKESSVENVSSSSQETKETTISTTSKSEPRKNFEKAVTKKSQVNASEKKSSAVENTDKKSSDNISTSMKINTPAETSNLENISTVAVKNTIPSLNRTYAKNTNENKSAETSMPKAVKTKSPALVQDETEKPTFIQRKTASKTKNANSQKVYTSAKQIEESSLDTLNIVFQSQPKNLNSEKQLNSVKTSENSINKVPVDLVPDVLPVEKVAEEMEKLILEQLEEEERAKELASGLLSKSPFGSPEHLLTAPPKLAEPPKEKPPPPPPPDTEGNQKDPSLKRVNSTKRIKKEIHKRRSNFLGIDSAEESLAISEPSIPPPPALEEILKAEMELDRQTRLQIDNAATERLTLEENEIIQKEREIIETLESEERCKQLINGTADFYDTITSNESDVVAVEEQIKFLKSEQKRLEIEKINEEQQLRLMEDTHLQELKEREEFILKEREEFIRKQEAGKSAVSDSSLSVASKVPNTPLPSLSSDTQSQVSNSDAIGDGNILTSSTNLKTSKDLPSDSAEKVPPKPTVPPKPLKKKEAIRKERERLRQEQEALQREREEHRQKLLQEQEELLKHQKAHAPDVPVPRLGVLPPLVPPSFQTPLTATPFVRDNASHPSRSHHGASNVPVRSNDTAELMSPVIAKQSKMPPARKPVQNETWGQQKVTSVRKQNHDSLTENRYNQNHWLIQEAEMRRIAELRDRQRTSQLSRSQPNLAEDDVCSNVPRVPMILPSHNQHLNYAVQDKMWNYNQPNVMPIKKYPPPIVTRETVSHQPPVKPSRVVPMERQEQMLSVSGRKRCSHCNEELGRGAAMIIESLQLYYHIHCFQCCVCQAQLGNGSCGADVRVRNQKLHCHNCYSNDEAGLKFSQV